MTARNKLFQLFVSAIIAVLLACAVAGALLAIAASRAQPAAARAAHFGVVVIVEAVAALTPSDRPAPLGVAAPGVCFRRNSPINEKRRPPRECETRDIIAAPNSPSMRQKLGCTKATA
jgi:hypothetical protein